MDSNRRTFFKRVSAAGTAITVAGPQMLARAQEPQPAERVEWSAEMPKGMTFCALEQVDDRSLGIKLPQGILDVREAATRYEMDVPETVELMLLSGGGPELAALVAKASADAETRWLQEPDVQFAPCVPSPEKIIMLGLNYRKHAEEVKQPVPKSPILFNKYNNALMGHRGTLTLPSAVAEKFDYEVELVIVIGKKATNVSEDDALSYVFGYCVGNDFSARDLQTKTSQFMLGKTCDGFAPLGPYLVCADLVPDPNKLAIGCDVNGESRQASNTGDMVFNCKQVVSYISQHMTLQPGDIIFTGTPEGVIAGYPKEKQVWLKAGDEVVSRIEGLGELRFVLG